MSFRKSRDETRFCLVDTAEANHAQGKTKKFMKDGIQKDIVLLALNARYRHTSFGLRCLKANLGELQSRTVIVEAIIKDRAIDMVESLLSYDPKIVGLGVYIWNTALALEVVSLLKKIRPNLVVVLGGPEVSYETQGQPIVELADHTVCGEGEEAFRALAEQILAGNAPTEKILQGTTPDLDTLEWPYPLYDDKDIAHRVVYVEASRGCPYRCQFCLSSLDKTVRNAPLEPFLAQMESLLERGATDFKFIDRTFNLRPDISAGIVSFFLERYRPGISLHFEMVPDRLPNELRTLLAQFPPGAVQLEVGIQTFDDETAKRIERRQNLEATATNLRYLREETGVHLHTDLIVGLPGESVPSFGDGLDRLMVLRPHEIQVGILKRLKGTPIVEHDEAFSMVYSPIAPFEILSTADISFEEMQVMKRFARYWDLVVNNGNFEEGTGFLWKNIDSPFDAFMALSAWLYQDLCRTSGISLIRLSERLLAYLTEERGFEEAEVGPALARDYQRIASRKTPPHLRTYSNPAPANQEVDATAPLLKRQKRHAANTTRS
jgi:radical SAM superfamily enzyme YgiQ (UPF0313 family)